MSLWQRLEALALKAAVAFLRRLSPESASNLGGFVARNFGPLLPVSRVADVNLRLALPELNRAERRAVIRAMWDNLGRTVAEFVHLPHLSETPRGAGWEIEGAEILEQLAARGGPAILFSGHIGNWEVLPPATAAYGVAFANVYRAAANPFVDRLIVQLRRQALRADVPSFAKGAEGARGAFQHLLRGGYLGMLMDQKLNDGIAVPFFGRPAMTAPSLAVLALRFRCPVIPGYVRRVGPARLRVVVEPPLALPDSGDREADVAALTAEVNAILERWIRAWPEGWLWLHRRWPKEEFTAAANGARETYMAR